MPMPSDDSTALATPTPTEAAAEAGESQPVIALEKKLSIRERIMKLDEGLSMRERRRQSALQREKERERRESGALEGALGFDSERTLRSEGTDSWELEWNRDESDMQSKREEEGDGGRGQEEAARQMVAAVQQLRSGLAEGDTAVAPLASSMSMSMASTELADSEAEEGEDDGAGDRQREGQRTSGDPEVEKGSGAVTPAPSLAEVLEQATPLVIPSTTAVPPSLTGAALVAGVPAPDLVAIPTGIQDMAPATDTVRSGDFVIRLPESQPPAPDFDGLGVALGLLADVALSAGVRDLLEPALTKALDAGEFPPDVAPPVRAALEAGQPEMALNVLIQTGHSSTLQQLMRSLAPAPAAAAAAGAAGRLQPVLLRKGPGPVRATPGIDLAGPAGHGLQRRGQRIARAARGLGLSGLFSGLEDDFGDADPAALLLTGSPQKYAPRIAARAGPKSRRVGVGAKAAARAEAGVRAGAEPEACAKAVHYEPLGSGSDLDLSDEELLELSLTATNFKGIGGSPPRPQSAPQARDPAAHPVRPRSAGQASARARAPLLPFQRYRALGLDVGQRTPALPGHAFAAGAAREPGETLELTGLPPAVARPVSPGRPKGGRARGPIGESIEAPVLSAFGSGVWRQPSAHLGARQSTAQGVLAPKRTRAMRRR